MGENREEEERRGVKKVIDEILLEYSLLTD